jgi:hypothetical protein
VMHHAGCPIVLVPADSDAVHRRPLRRLAGRETTRAAPTAEKSVETTLRWHAPTDLRGQPRRPRLAPALVVPAAPEPIARQRWR